MSQLLRDIKHDKSQYSQAFDCFRAIAVISVVTGHFATSQTEIPLWLKYILQIPLNYGVPIFFIISGYLLTASFQSTMKKLLNINHAYFYFIKKRAYRIYPAYLVAILVLFSINGFDSMNLITHILNIHNFWVDYDRAINPVFWSLGVEFQWYLIAPFLIATILNSNIIGCFGIMMLLVVVSLILRNFAVFQFVNQNFNVNKMVTIGNDQMIIHLYAFALGILLYKVDKLEIVITRINSLFCWLSLIVLAVLNFYWITNIDYRNPLGVYALSNFSYLSQFLLSILLFKYRHIRIKQQFISLSVYYIAAISYSLYIWHHPISNYINYQDISITIKFFYYIACSFTIATISYFVFERFFIASVGTRAGWSEKIWN
jgi:peptidoglycan/LPS O-acetylase OafA/YrhL